MRIFVTGATGWVGSLVVQELLGTGYQVTALVRARDKAGALSGKGVDVVHGTLDDLALLRDTAAASDAVIHTAFHHDFTKFAQSAEQDRLAVLALGEAFVGSERRLIATSGLGGINVQGRAILETDVPNPESLRKSESAVGALRERGVRASVVRLAPSVHGQGEGLHGFIPTLIRIAREKSVSAYIGDGLNRWAGVHRSDAARIFRLVLERAECDPIYHAMADEAVPFKEIAAVIARGLGVPLESRPREHFSWFANFAAANMYAESADTRAKLGWEPAGPDLLSDIAQPSYYSR